MKKMIFIASLLVLCFQFSGFAQKSRVGFLAGPVFSNLRGTVDNVDLDGKTKIGFAAGFLVDAPINGHIGFQPALYYVQKGTITQEVEEPMIKDRKRASVRLI